MTTGLKRLLLIRHAHAEGPPPGGADRDRSLSSRGEQAARALGEWLASEELVVERMYVSSARRTMQTAELMRVAMPDAPELVARDELYLASPTTLRECIVSCPDELSCVALIAHNPGIWEYASHLAKRSGQVVGSYSPSTCTIFELEGIWADFAAATASLIAERRG